LVSLSTTIGLGVLAAVALGAIRFRSEIGETASTLSGAVAGFGTSFQTAISAILSPRIAPTFGLNLESTGLPEAPLSEIPSNCRRRPVFQFCNDDEISGGTFFNPTCCPTTDTQTQPGTSSGPQPQKTEPERKGARDVTESGLGLFEDLFDRFTGTSTIQVDPKRPSVQKVGLTIPAGASIPSIASSLGLGMLSSAEGARLGIRSGDLGFQVRAFQEGKLSEEGLRSGFRQAVAQ